MLIWNNELRRCAAGGRRGGGGRKAGAGAGGLIRLTGNQSEAVSFWGEAGEGGRNDEFGRRLVEGVGGSCAGAELGKKKRKGYGGGRFVEGFIDARDLKLSSFSY